MFHQQLVLHRWIMGFFKGATLQTLKNELGDIRHEGIDEDGQTGFFHQLTPDLFEINRMRERELRGYDLNLVAHWNAVTERRNQREGVILNMKYFQYLSLLCTEIYLDWYFNKPQQLLDGLNWELTTWNSEQKDGHSFQPFDFDELNKIAFWNATGSGKTLLMHVHIRQYLHYFQQKNRTVYPDKIILLTPNEGLSRQHLEEFHLSGFGLCCLFDKNRSNVFKGTIEIIDINKLGDEMGDKTVAVQSFEGRNLVLVDEGHRGTGTAAGAWMSRREILVRGGFAFEYSATFGQAVSKSLTVHEAEEKFIKQKARQRFGTPNFRQLTPAQRSELVLSSDEKRSAKIIALREMYAKSILFDYSYKYFYEDGYGKEFLILNLKDEYYAHEDTAREYFIACLLGFYQQQFLWRAHHHQLKDFNIEKPLWVFVGNTVSGEDSDILNVLKLFAGFLNDDVKTKLCLKNLLANSASILDAKGQNIFHDRFVPLMVFDSEDAVYNGILKTLFNADARQRLKVVNLKTSKGELALRVGENEPFGLINIGDDAAFFREAQNSENLALFDTQADDFAGSMFGTLNQPNSALHVLIGSRKFTEGWSSWRVSTMGLLNMGKGEGSQIIQLFGRGVRLKGLGFSLKRSLPAQRPRGTHLERLECLNVFGINAGYMATFKAYLKEEGIATDEDILQLNFETRQNLPKTPLKTLTLKDGYKENQLHGFKRHHFLLLYEVPAEFVGKINPVHIDLDLYPQVDAMLSAEKINRYGDFNFRHSGKIDHAIMAFFNFDRIYLALQEFKHLRGFSNVRLDFSRLKSFCLTQNDWYTLFVPTSELSIKSMADIVRQENILIRLLQDYTDRFYKTLKNSYEGQYYDVTTIQDDSLLKFYHFEIDNTADGQTYKRKIEALQVLVRDGKLGEANKWHAGQMKAICFDRHLYYPLIALEGKVPLTMRPLAFDAPGEVQFVRDLEKLYNSPEGQQMIGGRSLYLLRNADTQAKGLGFALAGNFYPDFLLWLVDANGQQWLNFIDPKGIRQMNLDHPKLGLYKQVKVIEQQLADPQLILNAFVLSGTPFYQLVNVTCKKSELEARHVLFMEDGGAVYLKKLFELLK